MKNLKNYLDEMCQIDFFLRTKNEAVEEWGEDIPMTLLFANFGKAIAREFSQMPPNERVSVFNAIEIGMLNGDEALKAVLAAGLLEALYGQIHDDKGLTEEVMNCLNDVSKDHLLKWISWGGMEE
ncbi:hypothetical protein [Herbaspirillum rubrisubalbicans]|uniref:hypothetical protein n=1 Tax=Herbaspirillum rubrisubalbicans TaxID=80842 RepID=UPI0015C57ECF|nr:hypothetical protein [Herbaspirillum rubrisubalbicans]NQE51500.1 hypothetical protein [Herbaspirillum rubrisubalbicans]